MKELYVIDALNLLFRSYYAIAPMTNPRGESTNALYGFIRSVYKIIKECKPSSLVAVFDGPSSTEKRKEIYSDYKIHRKGMPEDLYPQLVGALRFCEIANIPFLSVPGVEADDVIGSIAKWTSPQKITTFICTSDKDLCQLVDENTFVLNVHKEMLKLDREKVKEIYGVFPEQVVDYLALMGDASDNIPGIEGIGPKTASTLLNEYGTLDELLKNTAKLSEKRRAQIESGRESVIMSRQLAAIHTEVEIPQQFDFYKLKEPKLDELQNFYHEMRFLTLLKELPSAEPAADQPIILQCYTLINDQKSLEELVDKLMKEKEICVDTETTDIDPMRAELVGIGLGVRPGEAWYIPFNGALDPIETLKPLFESQGFYGHNIKYDMHALKRSGLEIKKVIFDTMLASYLLAPHKQRHGLDTLALELFGKVKIPISDLIGKGKNQLSMRDVPIEKVATYCCEDVDYTIRLKKKFEKEIEKEKLQNVLEEIELPLLPILFEMEETGIFLDLEKLGEMGQDLAEHLYTLTHEIYKIAGEIFNLNSPKQLSEILFEKLSIKPLQKTTTGYSTSADVLEELKDSSPIIPKILDYRTLEKLRSTYIDALPHQVNPDSQRIHCTFNQSVTATGRLSCQDPNLQNIPVRSTEGRRIRTAFRPQLPGWSYLAADYSQIELRLLAHFSEDPELIRAFNAGEDIHTHTASLVFDLPIDQVKPEMRYAAKAVNFGILYGQQAFGLSKELSISIEEAKKFIETYFSRYPKVQEYLEDSKEKVRKTGHALTLTGRRRPIPEINSKNPMLRQAAERLATNTPLQGTAADLIKLAMIEIHKKIPYMILQIHDELIFELPDEDLEKVSHLVKESMERVWKLKIPLVVDISIGKNWGEC